MLAMQVNHSSLLRSWLLIVVSFSRSSWEPSVSLSLSLSFSISLYPLSLPPSGLPFIQFTLSFVAMKGEKTYVRCIAYHAAFRPSPDQRHYTIVSVSLSLSLLLFLSVPFPHRSLAIKFCVFQRTPCGIRKAKRDEAEFRAKEREGESKATNKFSRIILSARG